MSLARALASEGSRRVDRVFRIGVLSAALAVTVAGGGPIRAQALAPNEAREIAKDATIYGFPLVDSYRIQYSYFVDPVALNSKPHGTRSSNNARVKAPLLEKVK